MDALLTQRHVAQTIVDKNGDYVMIVKENQPQLRADIELVFTLPLIGDRQDTAWTIDLGHGRIEQRNLTTSAALVGTVIGPGWRKSLSWGGTLCSPKQAGSCWIPGSWMCRWRTTQLLSPFPP